MSAHGNYLHLLHLGQNPEDGPSSLLAYSFALCLPPCGLAEDRARALDRFIPQMTLHKFVRELDRWAGSYLPSG